MDPDKVWNLAIIFVFAGIVGAKLLMFIAEWDTYAANPREIFTSRPCKPVAFSPAAWYWR